MPDQPTYANVILPLHLPELTYAIPKSLRDEVLPGMRVVVPLGKQKFYTGIVSSLHNSRPTSGQIKEILELQDEAPVVTETQLKFWGWMSSYYLCEPGDVMQASLPSALKLDSTSIVELVDAERVDEHELTHNEFVITETLLHEGPTPLNKLKKLTGLSSLNRIVNRLRDMGVVDLSQELEEKYKPKTEAYVRLHPKTKEEHLHITLDLLEKAPKQQQLLLAFAELLEEGKDIKKAKLLKFSGQSAAILKALADKEILEIYDQEVGRLRGFKVPTKPAPELTAVQQTADEELIEQLEQNDVVLLHGVTGSGKTHLYYKHIQQHIDDGRQVLYLIPEIALTSQLVQRLQSIFGDTVGVYHSRFNDQERVEIWNKVLAGEYKVIIGARSALLLPFKELGLVIVDEEHDTSFKQFDPAPRYEARDAAVYLAALFGCKTILGTATPAVETWFNAKQGKYGYVRLAERYKGMVMPTTEVVDIRDQTHRKQMHGLFSSVLIDAMRKAIDNDEQVILFQNKRGFSPYVICGNCGTIPQCKNCDVSLTYHKYSGTLQCHYCGYSRPMTNKCESCFQHEVKIQGFGTEQIEEELGLHFPEARVARMDLDTTRGKHAHETLINQFADREIDILVGTQMVTKGLDFEHVSLVGILSADQLLSFPDFRVHERAFHLMEQVSGRAGRHKKPGRVIIQALKPNHEVVQAVVHHRWEQFYQLELEYRHQWHYPPYRRLIRITLKHRDRNQVALAASLLGDQFKKHLQSEVLGPAVPVIGRVRNMYLQDILIKVPRDKGILPRDKPEIANIIQFMKNDDRFKSIWVHIDVDPY